MIVHTFLVVLYVKLCCDVVSVCKKFNPCTMILVSNPDPGASPLILSLTF